MRKGKLHPSTYYDPIYYSLCRAQDFVNSSEEIADIMAARADRSEELGDMDGVDYCRFHEARFRKYAADKMKT